MKRFSAKVNERLKYYVYIYIDPRDNRTFYVGKGKGNRVFDHLDAASDSVKGTIIAELRRIRLEPRIELLKYGLTEKEALLVEATAIDLLDVKNLSNESRGHGSRYGSRASVDQVVATLDAKEAAIEVPALLINIKQAFRYGMSAMELYDATRSAWTLGEKRKTARYVFSVFRGIVREIYEVSAWVRGGTSIRCDDLLGRRPRSKSRWEFVGVVAPDELRGKYVGKSVAGYFPKGSQNPVRYVNCP